MDYIEYVQIFISLVYGLAFTRIIASYAVIIRNFKTINFYWPYFPMSLGLLIFVINDFWTGFARNQFLVVGTSFALKMTFVIALITPISYTIVAELLYPKIKNGNYFDMSDIVTARRTGYVITVATTSFNFIKSLITVGISTSILAQIIRVTFMVIFTVGIFSKNEKIQKIIVVLFFLMAIAWFLFENEV